jgi:hypothetical protein
MVDTNARVVFLDCPRSKQGDFIQYDFLEELKNGYMFSPKYHSCVKTMPSPHVVVMMNEQPDMSKLSVDRYDIFMLTNDRHGNGDIHYDGAALNMETFEPPVSPVARNPRVLGVPDNRPTGAVPDAVHCMPAREFLCHAPRGMQRMPDGSAYFNLADDSDDDDTVDI